MVMSPILKLRGRPSLFLEILLKILIESIIYTNAGIRLRTTIVNGIEIV
jgi:hypothetical protein